MQVKEPIDRVLDVGTGATLIYPLLGCALFKWKFTAIEINEKSYQSSKKIIEIN
jgi:23S rRNA (adenine1618-N6)-methyltransferase